MRDGQDERLEAVYRMVLDSMSHAAEAGSVWSQTVIDLGRRYSL